MAGKPRSDIPRRKPSTRGARLQREFSAADRQRLDLYMLLVLRLIEQEDWRGLLFRTGIRRGADTATPQYLSFLVRLATGEKAVRINLAVLARKLANLGLDVPPVYFNEIEANRAVTHVTARLGVDPVNPGLLADGRTRLVDRVKTILGEPAIARLDLAVSCQPCLQDSLQHLGLACPIDRTYGGKLLRGKGVVVGIVDDGCALAHRHFLDATGGAGAGLASRILALWDQSQAPTTADSAQGWTKPAGMTGQSEYGREIGRAAIEAAINAHVGPNGVPDEAAVYRRLRYQPGAPDDLASHGTHVMDIAAGNGSSVFGWEGVAPEADIVFVQLPPVDVENPGPALSKAILDAVAYVFSKAKPGQPVVVNLSYGGNRGPHNATYEWTKLLDDELAVANRAIVVSAGNGFEQRTHARKRLRPGKLTRLRWLVGAEDPTPNDLEIWCDAAATLEVELKAPGGAKFGPFGPGSSEDLHRPGDGRIIGSVNGTLGATDRCLLVSLRATSDEPAPPTHAPAPSGTWSVTVRNQGASTAEFHAWIQRDDTKPPGAARTQSRFHPEDADPASTICDLACGTRTISVGAFNCATGEMCGYSSCGPTRPDPGKAARRKPEVCAPAEEDAAGRGVLSASSSRSLPTRMNGTSVAAPHVAGLVALMFEYAAALNPKRVLSADEIAHALIQGARAATLRPNTHQAADARVPVKQDVVWNDLIGGGRVDFCATMRKLFP